MTAENCRNSTTGSGLPKGVNRTLTPSGVALANGSVS
jgi:hypothetical protein